MDIQTSIEIYIQACFVRGLRMETLKSYSYDLYKFGDYLPSTNTCEITCNHLREYLSHHLVSGLKASTVERKRKSIALWIAWMSREGMADLPDVKNRVGPIRADKQAPMILNNDELSRFLIAAETMHYHSQFAKLRDVALLHVLCDTGLRRSEIMRMTLDKVDLHRRLICVSAESKGRRERVVMFTPETLRHLRGYLRVRHSGKTNLLWLNIFGEPGTYGILKTAIKRVSKAAGMSGIHPHTLRHSFATKCVQLGMPLTSVQKLLGHAAISTTMIYVHIADEVALQDYEQYFE